MALLKNIDEQFLGDRFCKESQRLIRDRMPASCHLFPAKKSTAKPNKCNASETPDQVEHIRVHFRIHKLYE